MKLFERLRRTDLQPADDAPPRPGTVRSLRRLPDPGLPPAARGSWEEAALTNVDVTELVKRELRTNTRPWEK